MPPLARRAHDIVRFVRLQAARRQAAEPEPERGLSPFPAAARWQGGIWAARRWVPDAEAAACMGCRVAFG